VDCLKYFSLTVLVSVAELYTILAYIIPANGDLSALRQVRKYRMRLSIGLIFFVALPALAQIDYKAGFVKGRITFYSQSPIVACDIPQSEWPQYTAALSEKQFKNGLACGTTAIIKNGTKQIQVMVVDLCPVKGNEQWCSGDLPHFDLGGQTAFSQMENPSVGVKEVQIDFIPTPVGDSPVKLRNKDNINAYWYAVQVLNHRYPIAKVEMLDQKTEAWITGQQKTDMCSYWIFTFTGSGMTTPFRLRITDQFGQKIEETGTSIESSYMWSGTHQFPIDSAFTGILRQDRAEGGGDYLSPFVATNRLFCGASLPAELTIVDCTGREAAVVTITSNTSRIRVPPLPRAVYYVRVKNKQKVSLLRWMNVNP
jgi:expansin